MAEWGVECGFKSYQEEAKPFSVAKQPRLFIQTESLHHLLLAGDVLPDITHKVVLLDEMATILKSLVPGKTQRENLVNNLRVFHHLVSKADIVIAGDAFLHDREMSVLRSIRPESPLRLLNNQFNPYSHRTFQQVRIMGTSKDGKKEVEKVKAGQQEFLGRIIKDLKEGLRVVLVLGSKKVGLKFETIIKEAFPAPAVISYSFYHSESDPEVKARDLAHVDKSWAGLNLLMYTPTITVGVNYDDPAPPFNRLYIYACRGGPTPRDIFQASLRCRKIEPPAGQPHMVFFLDWRGGGASYYGRSAVQRRLMNMLDSTMAAMDQALLAQEEVTTREERQGWWFFKPKDEMPEVPQWFPSLYVDNVNEANVSMSFPKEVYAHYIERCGYTPVGAQMTFVDEPPLLPKDLEVPSYWDVPSFNAAKTKSLRETCEQGGSMSVMERLGVAKHYFDEQVGIYSDVPEEMPEWTKDRELVDAMWRGRGPCAADCATNHHKPTCVEDCVVSHRHLVSGFNGGYLQHRAQFKHISLSKMASPAATLSACAALDYKAGGLTALSPHSYGAKVVVIQKVCEVLGIAHPGVQHVWRPKEWYVIVGEMRRERTWEDLPDSHVHYTSSLEDRVLDVFSLRDRGGQDGAKEQSGAVVMAGHISRAMESWCGSTVDVSMDYKRGTEKTKDAVHPVPEGFSTFQAFKRAEVKSPERIAAAAAGGASTPEEVKQWIEDKVEEEFPKAYRFHGVHLCPWENRVVGGSRVGSLWSFVRGYVPKAEDHLEIEIEEGAEEME